jgi:aerobic carbon-monoxide dehydrogenase small subunit
MSELWPISLSVNGKAVEVTVSPFTTLVQILRDHLDLRGTKVGCNEGECGSCTVIMNGQPVSSCLVLAPQAEGADVWTIEGLPEGEKLHPMQDAFLREGAVQCGFCSPGFIMSGVSLLRRNPRPTEDEIREAIEGNLCRCTGYQKIVRAIQSCSQATTTAETAQ